MPAGRPLGDDRTMGWTIRRHGTDLEVVAGDATRESVLLAGGEEVDRQVAGYWETSTLTHDDLRVEVRWGPRNTIVSSRLLGDDHPVPLVPPPGSWAAKREALARDHPTQFVVRRVAVAGAEIVLGVIGVSVALGALFGQLLPRIDLSWIPRPDLPDVDPPDWLRHLDPAYWLGRLGLSWPDVDAPAWLEAVMDQRKYWLPLVIALFVALGELDRRRKRDAERDDDATDVRDEDEPRP
jgi:hypothetical protein